jgi:hypothetical protein
MSRSLIIGVLGTLLVIAVLSALFYQHYIKSGIRPLHHAIPNSAIFFIESENWNSLYGSITELPAYNELIKNDAVKPELFKLQQIDSLLKQNTELFNLIHGDKIGLSMHVLGKDIAWFLVIQTKKIPPKLEAINDLLTKLNLKVSKRLFENQQVFDAYQSDGSPVLSISSLGDFMFLSAQGSLVEDAIRKIKYTLTNDWRSINKPYNITNGKYDHNVYINYGKLHHLFTAITIDSIKADKFLFSSFASWSVLQTEIEKTGIAFKGATYTDDSIFQFLDVLNNQKPVSADKMFAYLPANLAFYQHIGIQNYPQFKSDLKEYNDFHGSQDSIQQYVMDIKQKSGFNLDELSTFFGENHFLIISEFNQGEITSNASAILQINKPEECLQAIKIFASKINSGISDSLFSEYTYLGKQIYYLHAGKLPAYYFGAAFNIIENPFVAVYEEVLIMSNTLAEMKSIIDRLSTKQVLVNDEQFIQVTQKQKTLSNYSMYINSSKAYQIPYQFYESSMLTMMNIYMKEMKKITHIHLQYASANDKTFYTGMYLAYDNAFEEDTRIMWSYLMDTTAIRAPELVDVDGKKGVFVQDVLNQCYLFDESGSLKWKVKLSQAIVSELHQVIVSPTNTRAYLFNTSESVYLLNENGNNMSGYPVRLPGKTKFALSMVDWYGDSTYEYYVVLNNKRVAGYQLNGRILPNWTAKPISDSAISAIGFITTTSEKLLVVNQHSSTKYYSLDGKKRDSVLVSHTKLPLFVSYEEGKECVIWTKDSTRLYLNQFDTAMQVSKSNPIALISANARFYLHNGNLFVNDKKKLTVWRTNGVKVFEISADSIAQPFAQSFYSKGVFYGFLKYPEATPVLLAADGAPYENLPSEKFITFTVGNNKENTQKILVGTSLNKQIIFYLLK